MGLFLRSNNTFSFGRGFSAELNGFYGRQKSGYIVMEPYGELSAGAKKSLLDGKLTISLNANDLLNTWASKQRANYGNIHFESIQNTDTRNVSLSIRYNFGSSTVKASRRRSSGIEDEAGRAR